MRDSVINPRNLDNGIRDAVLLLHQGGFRTFTSCEGGRGHSFQEATIGLVIEGLSSTFRKKLVRFLRSHGMEHFTINLITDYHREYPEGKQYVYLNGLDLLSPEKRRRVIESIRRRERRLMLLGD